MAKLTQRQQAEQKEAKKLRTNTIIFTVAIALVLSIGIGLIGYNWFASSGLPQRFTTALEIGEHKLTVAELNYYYIDSLNSLGQDWYSMYLLQVQDGFKSNVALDKQQYKNETGKTWADHFVEEAIKEASGVLALCDAAKKAGYSLTDEDKATIADTLIAIETEGMLYGYSSLTEFLEAMYGKGSQEKTFRTYVENCTLAQSYYNHYVNDLSYTDKQIADKDAEIPGYFSSFNYTYYTLKVHDFLEHEDKDKHDHSDADTAAAREKAEAIAKELVASGATNKEALDAAIANLEMYKSDKATDENTSGESTNDEASTEIPLEPNKDDGEEDAEDKKDSVTVPTSTQRTNYEYDYIPTEIAKWLTEEGREAGKIGYIPYYVAGDDGEPTEELDGYYVVILDSENKNEEFLVSVRHILVAFKGGTKDKDTGNTVYSDEEKKTASDEAERIKAEYEAGEKTQDAFAALAKKYSADNAEEGGLYEDVYPGQMETAFNDWCFEEGRKPGDVGIVETTYGYHVMYFVETQEETYREHLVTDALRSEEAEAWYTGLQDSHRDAAKVGNTSYLNTSIVLSK